MRTGVFVLADIGDSTSFITDVGIEHGKEIVGRLLNAMFEVAARTNKPHFQLQVR